MTFELWISGHPAPGGSKRAIPLYVKGKLYLKNGRPIINMVDDAGERNKVWKQSVNLQAFSKFRQPAWEGPLMVEFHFTMPRPRSHYFTGLRSDLLRPDAPMLHTHKPDLTKLIRSTEDALTGRLWVDDSQICYFGECSKNYGLYPGCRVLMKKVTPPDQPELAGINEEEQKNSGASD